MVPPASLVRTVAARFARELRARYGEEVHGVRLSPSVFDRETWEKWRAQERRIVMDIERAGG